MSGYRLTRRERKREKERSRAMAAVSAKQKKLPRYRKHRSEPQRVRFTEGGRLITPALLDCLSERSGIAKEKILLANANYTPSMRFLRVRGVGRRRSAETVASEYAGALIAFYAR